MKYLRILVEPFEIKGDPNDEEQLKQDVYEKIAAMLEAEVLGFSVDEDMEEEDDF